jgi:malate permease and related proteins
MNILSTIIPIFIVILLGLGARKKGLFSPDFMNQANKVVYYIGIPALIFSAVSKSSLKTDMNVSVILITLLVILFLFGLAWGMARFLNIQRHSKGSFIQSTFHGNIGYIALAVIYYYLGQAGFVKAAIIASFVMILQNILAVGILQFYSEKQRTNPDLKDTLKKTLVNPVILSALVGILFSLLNLELPAVLNRAIDILKGMALPMALLIIGASLSFEKTKSRFKYVIIASFIKLIISPCIGLVLYRFFGLPMEHYMPALIILASPSATLTYIMAKELDGDPDYAVAVISLCTIISCATFGIWLSLG